MYVDISSLYNKAGVFTYDPGFTSSASCKSDITFIDGDQGVLSLSRLSHRRTRRAGSFLETCHLLLYGELPNAEQIRDFVNRITYHTMIHEQMDRFFPVSAVTPTRWP